MALHLAAHAHAGLTRPFPGSINGFFCAPCHFSGSRQRRVGSVSRKGRTWARCSGDSEEQGSRASMPGPLLAFSAVSPFLAGGAAAAGGGAEDGVQLHSGGVESVAAFLHGLPLADLDPDTAGLLANILGPLFASMNFLFILRIVMSWYPALPVGKFPFVIAYAPTEPVLEPTRRLIRPVGGVDISPIVWVALLSFLNEILLGQQGLLVLLSQERL